MKEPDWSVARARRLLGLGSLALLLVRVWIVVSVPSPFLFADETVGLGTARFIAGYDVEFAGPSGRPLLGLLLSPFAWALDTPRSLHLAALLLNVVLGLLLIPLTYLTGQKVLGLPRSDSAVAALAASGSAAAVSFTAIAMPEQLLAFVTLACLPALASQIRRQSSAGIMIVSFMFAGLFSGTHPRGDALAIALILTLGLAGVRGLTPVRSALFASAAAVAGSGLMIGLSRQINVRLYQGQTNASYSAPDLVSSSLEAPVLIARAALGSAWYVVLSTLGIAVLGLLGLVVETRSATPWRSVPAAFGVLAVLGAWCSSSIFVSLIMSGQGRVDSFAYGRYVEHLFPLLFLYAPVAWHSVALRRVAIVASLIVAGAGAFVSVAVYEPDFWTGPTLKTNIPMLWYLWERPDPISPLAATAVGIVLTLAMSLLLVDARRRTIGMIALTTAATITAVGLVRSNIVPYSNYLAEWRPVAERLNENRANNVAVATDAYPGIQRHLVQFWADDAEFDHYESTDLVGPSAEWILALTDEPLPPGRTGVRSYVFDAQDTVIWRLDP